jgi:putative ABC transport system substrate-binding protein
MPAIGFLGSASAAQFAERVRAFRQGLGEAGYVEGRNVAVEFRWAEGRNDRLAALASDLARREVKAIVTAGGLPAARAAKAATTAIPVIFQTGFDPVLAGLVTSFGRPDGNLTGVTTLSVGLEPKQVEIIHELVPKAVAVARIENPTNVGNEVAAKLAASAARARGLKIHIVHASSARDLDGLFATVERLKLDALLVSSDPFVVSQSEQLAARALRARLPAIASYRAFAAAGGLASYGSSLAAAYRILGSYAGRILKGEKVADLPVQQATKVELVINLKTAKALGLTVPLSLLGRADEVIE